MSYRTNRRQFLAGSAAAASAAAFQMPSIAQSAPLKIGLLTVKTGPLAAGGIHFEEGISSFLKDKRSEERFLRSRRLAHRAPRLALPKHG